MSFANDPDDLSGPTCCKEDGQGYIAVLQKDGREEWLCFVNADLDHLTAGLLQTTKRMVKGHFVLQIIRHFSMIMMMRRRRKSRMMLLHRKAPVEKKSCTRRGRRGGLPWQLTLVMRRGLETQSKKETIIRSRNDAINTGGNWGDNSQVTLLRRMPPNYLKITGWADK